MATTHLKPHRLLSHSCCRGDAKKYQKAWNAKKPIPTPTPATMLNFIGPGWLFSLQCNTDRKCWHWKRRDGLHNSPAFSRFPFTPYMTLLLHSLIPCSNMQLSSSHTLASSSLASYTSGEQLQPLGIYVQGLESLCVCFHFSQSVFLRNSVLWRSQCLCLQMFWCGISSLI